MSGARARWVRMRPSQRRSSGVVPREEVRGRVLVSESFVHVGMHVAARAMPSRSGYVPLRGVMGHEASSSSSESTVGGVRGLEAMLLLCCNNTS